MNLERPDLTGVTADVVTYIEALETQLLALQTKASAPKREPAALEPSEPPTTMCVITMTADAHAKRTARHLYYRQRRSGMGVFDIETSEDNPPVLIAVADSEADVLIISDQGRVFRMPVSQFAETPARGRGEPFADKLELMIGERIVSILPADGNTYLVLASERGRLRRVRSAYLNKSMIQGIRYHKIEEGGYVTAACWSDGRGDIFLATEAGLGIRFSENQISSTNSTLGMRVDPADKVIAVTATSDDGAIFMLNHEGKGTIRLMSKFRQNKAPGAGGKVAMKVEKLVAAHAVSAENEIFVISKLSKVIRFSAEEVPQKEGVVQGVNCMGLRSDETVACFISPPVAAIETTTETDDG